MNGLSVSSASLCASSSKTSDTNKPEKRSEPVATAKLTSPLFIAKYAYFKACIPAQHTHAGETTSIASASGSQPCVITPWLGIIWSGEDVPQDKSSIFFNCAGSLSNNSITAKAVICALVCVDLPPFSKA